MIGALNTTCEWCRKVEENKYGETTYTEGVTLPCAINKDVKMVQTDFGLVKQEEKYYILHTSIVKSGDKLDGYVVAVGEIKDLSGRVLYYKAVVLNG